MSDSSDNEIDFDNLLKHTGGKAFFESILGGIERQELNSSDSESDTSSESSSESDDSVSPLYADSSDSESVTDDASSSSDEEESPLFGAAEESTAEDPIETSQENFEEETDESPLFEKTGGSDSPYEEKNKTRTVADIKKIINDMSKFL
jgi:hypothetical protein